MDDLDLEVVQRYRGLELQEYEDKIKVDEERDNQTEKILCRLYGVLFSGRRGMNGTIQQMCS